MSTAFLLVLAQMVFIAITTKYVAIALPFCIGVLYPVQKFYLRTSRQLRFLDLEAKSPLYSHFMESLSGLPTIRAFNFQSANTQKNYRLLNASQRPYYQLYCIQRWLGLSLDMIVAGLAIVLIAICVELRTTISPGLLGLALVNLMSFNIHLVAAVTNWTLLETSIGAVSRVRQFEKQTPSEYHAADVHVEPPVDWPGQGAVEIRDLCLSYQ
jgi:ATP-binding cassette, subfamily C (CFTR/MRP), member 1